MPRSDVRPRFFDHVVQTLVTGVFAILPLGLTIAVVVWITRFLHGLVGPTSVCGSILRSVGMTVTACDVTAYVFGVIGAVLMSTVWDHSSSVGSDTAGPARSMAPFNRFPS